MKTENRALSDSGFATAFGQCIGCKHYTSENNTCPAFPDGVTREIFTKAIIHDKILSNQVGKTLFEPR